MEGIALLETRRLTSIYLGVDWGSGKCHFFPSRKEERLMARSACHVKSCVKTVKVGSRRTANSAEK